MLYTAYFTQIKPDIYETIIEEISVRFKVENNKLFPKYSEDYITAATHIILRKSMKKYIFYKCYDLTNWNLKINFIVI